MKTLRLLFALLFTTLAVRPAAALDLGFAEQDGGRPGSFLDFAASARSLGMGSAHAGVADDASSVYWNPAGLAALDRKDIVAMYSSLYEDTGFGFFSYAQPTVDMGTFGLGLVSLRSGSFEKRDSGGIRTGSFDSSETAFLLSHGIDLSDRFSVGSTAKVVRQEIDRFADTSYGLDAGAKLKLLPALDFGVTLRNIIAPKITLRRDADRYPRDLRAGFKFQALKRLLLAVDGSKTGGRSTKIHIGGEWTANHLLVLRAGLNEREMTAGLGFKFGDWGIDYAFGYHDAAADVEDLGASHRFGFRVSFGQKKADQEVSDRLRQLAQQRLADLQTLMENPGEPEKIQAAVDGAQDVIRRRGFSKPEDLYAAQGYIHYFEGRYERSVQALSEALTLVPGNLMVEQHVEKARALMTEEKTRAYLTEELAMAKEAYKRADWKTAVAACERILDLQPDHIEASAYLDDARARIAEPIEREMKIASQTFDRGQYLDAIKSLQRVKEMDPQNQSAAQMMDSAIRALEQEALQQNATPLLMERNVVELPRDLEKSRSYYSQGLIYYSQGQIREAATAWAEAVRFDDTNTLARNALSRAQIELKEQP